MCLKVPGALLVLLTTALADPKKHEACAAGDEHREVDPSLVQLKTVITKKTVLVESLDQMPSDRKKRGVELGRGGGGTGGGSSDPRMDTNDNGIATDAFEYEYGADIEVSFELTNDRVRYEVLSKLDVENIGQWTVGVFMRMEDPQDGGVPPILAVQPTIENAGDEPAAPPNINYKGTATISAANTKASVLDANKFGTGFDVWLLDEDGRGIIGPASFYMIQTEVRSPG